MLGILSLVLSFGVKYYSLREWDYCDKLLSVLGKYHCQVKSDKTISIVQTHWEAPWMKISNRLSVLADIGLYILDYRNIGKNLYRCNTNFESFTAQLLLCVVLSLSTLP